MLIRQSVTPPPPAAKPAAPATPAKPATKRTIPLGLIIALNVVLLLAVVLVLYFVLRPTPQAATQEGGAWWDVPVTALPRDAAQEKARAEYETSRARQRLGA